MSSQMSSQAFEILCPICRSVVPLDAPSCPNCPRTTRGAAIPAASPRVPAAPAPAPVAPDAPNLASLSMKDYPRVVRATYRATEGPATGSSRVRAYLPFGLLLLLLVVGAAMLYSNF